MVLAASSYGVRALVLVAIPNTVFQEYATGDLVSGRSSLTTTIETERVRPTCAMYGRSHSDPESITTAVLP